MAERANLSAGEKRQIADAINEIWTILRGLSGPASAARAIAGVHVMLMEENDCQDEVHVRAALRDVDTFVLESWAKRSGVPLAS